MTGYYQYNVARNFKGADKILGLMGYSIAETNEPKASVVKMQLKEPKILLQKSHKVKLAKLFVDLMLFDFELSILKECISTMQQSRPSREYTIIDAWKARKNTSDGVKAAVDYLHNHIPTNTEQPKNTNGGVKAASHHYNNPVNNRKQSKDTSGAVAGYHCNNPPIDPVTEQLKNTSSRSEAAIGYPHRDPPANNVTKQRFDPSTLPPPDLGDMSGEFGSVIPHINPSSHIDDDNNQLIKDSTELGYRNPPEAKFKVPSNLKPVVESVCYPPVTSDFGLPGQVCVPPITSSSTSITPSSNRDHKFEKSHPEVSGTSVLGQGHNLHSGSEFRYNTQLPNTAMYSGNIPTAGGPQSLPSVGSVDGTEASMQLGSFSHHKYNRQKSTPTDTSLSGEMAVSATTKSNQLAVTDYSPVVATVPLSDQPTPEASQAPTTSDSKFGKTNLNYLKNRLQHKKEVTQIVVQTGGAGAHSHSSSDYVNADTLPQMLQGSSDSTNKSTFGKSDLTSLRNKLEKTKEEREKNVVAAGGVSKASDYYNLSEVSSYTSGNPMMMNHLPNKKPMATPRTKGPTANSSHSASSTTSLKVHCKLWQCAHCQTINEAHHNYCIHCKLPCGRQADRSALCEFCQLMIFIPARGEITDVCCPRCKQVFETVL